MLTSFLWWYQSMSLEFLPFYLCLLLRRSVFRGNQREQPLNLAFHVSPYFSHNWADNSPFSSIQLFRGLLFYVFLKHGTKWRAQGNKTEFSTLCWTEHASPVLLAFDYTGSLTIFIPASILLGWNSSWILTSEIPQPLFPCVYQSVASALVFTFCDTRPWRGQSHCL